MNLFAHLFPRKPHADPAPETAPEPTPDTPAWTPTINSPGVPEQVSEATLMALRRFSTPAPSRIPAETMAALEPAPEPEDKSPKPLITPAPVAEPESVAPETTMSFLSTVGKDFKAVFAWLGSSKGQATIAGAEGVAEGVAAAVPGAAIPVAAGITLANTWINEAIKTEALAAAAGSQTGSGTQKAAAVLSTMTPELTAYLQSQGLETANVAAQATAINTQVVGLLNAIGTSVAVAPAPAAAPKAA